ncbi:FHA domain-containing protein FHA2 [Sorghum bicolor]|nr:FHA domain-containing protein FHA2 [Sorghum bicolor]|eukprot:XP_002451186.1 FHA domain-containing protein FHA2 [Sorghum bicolor]
MAAPNSVATSIGQGQKVPGFAKLQGENFVYFIQTYSVILGRNTESYSVDFDLSKYECRSQRVSRCHACIFYDFKLRHFVIEVIGRKGCTIRGVSYLPGSVPIKLNSQDLLEIAGIKFYFLLPSRSIFDTIASRDTTSLPPQSSSLLHPADYHGHPSANDCSHSNGENGVKITNDRKGNLEKQNWSFSGELDISNCNGISNADLVGTLDGVSKLDIQSAEKDIDDQQLLLEEEEVATCLAALISDLSGPRKWVPMEKLHSELFERFGQNWPHDRVSKYLSQKGMSGSSIGDGRPWCSLWTLFKKYPEHFVMSTVTRGQAVSEYVGLYHLVSLENES